MLAMVNPLNIVPLYLAVAKDLESKLRNTIIVIGTLVFVALLSFFAFFGDALLSLFEITVHAFKVAGGILVLLIGLDMLRAAPGAGSILGSGGKVGPSMGIVPLGVPLLAGPGAVSTVIVFQDIHLSTSHSILMTAVLVLLGIIVFFMLRAANVVEKIVGETGMQVFNKVMGLIVASIGVEFILDGVAGHFPELFNFDGHGGE